MSEIEKFENIQIREIHKGNFNNRANDLYIHAMIHINI